MSDYRDELERERRRHTMPADSYQRLQRRRDRKRRNRVLGSALIGLAIAAAGATGAVLAFRGTGAIRQPGTSPATGTPGASSSVAPSPTPSPLSGVAISGTIQFLDSDHGYWVTPGGTIEAKIGGSQPVAIYNGSRQAKAIALIDADHLVASTADGLLKTSDGGSSWTFVPGPSLSTFEFLDQDNGFGISPSGGTFPLGPGHLVTTHDGGATWTDAATPGPVESMCFVPGTSTGWTAAGANIYRTTDRGATWQTTNLSQAGSEVTQTTVRCDAERDAWALVVQGGAAGHIYHVIFHTSDGVNWNPVLQNGGLTPGTPDVPGVYTSGDPYPGPMGVTGPNSLAFAPWCSPCGNGTVDLLRTSDGGMTWNKVEVVGRDAKGGEPVGISFVDPNQGWILLTVMTDKGPTWGLVSVTGSSATLISPQTVP